MGKLRVLDLFSGIGGFSLGLERTGGFETVAFCEIEEFPRKVLAKHWPDVPCFEDVRELRAEHVGPVDVICGGYPCQPFSTAGKRRGAEDDRHLWPEFNRLVAELRPAWVIGENVAGHISMGLDDVLSDLEGQGYACRTFVIPACAVDAPHRRDRCWTVAHADSERGPSMRGKREDITQQGSQRRTDGARNVAHATQLQRNGSGEYREQSERQIPESGNRSGAQPLADAQRLRQSGQGQPIFASGRPPKGQGQTNHVEPISQPGEWCPEPSVGRVAHGVPQRVDRLKALGNAVVPQIPEMIGHAILEAEAAQ
jgi:DNA (cytosine-5)-methyltransferase 1